MHAPPIDSQLETEAAATPLGPQLAWLQRLLAWQVACTRQRFGALADDPQRGLYITDAEIDLLAAAAPDTPADLACARAELAQQRHALEPATRTSALGRLAQLFGLSRFERDTLLLALAPELGLAFERMIGYVHDDVTRRRPSVGLALRLLCDSPAELAAARRSFAPDAPLLRHQLIQLADSDQPPLLRARAIALDPRIANELLGCGGVDPQLAPFVRLSRPTRALEQLVLPPGFAPALLEAVRARGGGLILALQGSYGSGRRALAEAICAALPAPLLQADLELLPAAAEPSAHDPAEIARRLVREAMLQGAALLLAAGGRLFGAEAAPAWQRAFLAALDEHAGLTFIALEQPWEPRGALAHAQYVRIEQPALGYAGREQIWQQQLGDSAPAEARLRALASTFRLSGGQIRDAASMARTAARWRGGPLATPTPDELAAACRAQSSGKLNSLAHKISATYSWADIVLPADQIEQLCEICVQVRHRHTVLERWGFDKRLAMGKGINVLFAGSSGTGKTMAAEIIAADLGLELYKVDLSSMVSKYIGETEKNLDRIFTAAREANAILFFDEADAIFGKRSEVKDAHDRYANIEVGYLLQKMEEYDGVVILSTNLRKNMDDAFLRRLHVAIEFPFPEPADRLRIWCKVFPAEAPLAGDVDLAFMAERFRLAGGNIRNIALLAAYLAAEQGDLIDMASIIRATRREYQKLGKLVTEGDFGEYIALLRTPL